MLIADTINAAKAANFAQPSSAMIPDYRESVEALLSQLGEKEIPFVIVGGIAVLQYVSGRNTEDIDLIVAAGSLARIGNLVIQDQNDSSDHCRVNALPTAHCLLPTAYCKLQRSCLSTRCSGW